MTARCKWEKVNGDSASSITPCHSALSSPTDIDDCGSSNCQNGGSCVDGVASFTCACATGYTGSECEQGELVVVPHHTLNRAYYVILHVARP